MPWCFECRGLLHALPSLRDSSHRGGISRCSGNSFHHTLAGRISRLSGNMSVIVVAIASEIELRSFRRMIGAGRVEVRGGRGFFFGTMHGRDVCLVKTGVGRKNAAAAARTICVDLRPGMVIVAGAAGALGPELERGAIVVVESVVRESTREEIVCPEAPVRRALDVLREAGMATRSGLCCQAGTFVHRASDKHALHLKTRAHVVDMESAAFVHEFQRAGMPFVNIRVVSDAAGRDTVDMAALVRLRYRSGRLAAALWLCRHPRELMRIWLFYQGMGIAAVRIADVVRVLLRADIESYGISMFSGESNTRYCE
jgi:adenosylhomocysteine nucleosidase